MTFCPVSSTLIRAGVAVQGPLVGYILHRLLNWSWHFVMEFALWNIAYKFCLRKIFDDGFCDLLQVQSAVAPRMAMNFSMLVTGEKGFGYKGCQFFQAWRNESVICGDWEHNSGRGGRAALDGGPLFTPDDTRLPCIRGAVGMRRMSKKHSSLNQVKG